MNRTRIAILAMLFVITSMGNVAGSVDLDSCADDLDRIRRSARDAADKASDAKSKQDDVESCRNSTSSYDYRYDRCRSKVAYFQSAVAELRSELDTLDRRIRAIQSSCGYELTASELVPSTGDKHCDMIREYMNKLPYQNLLAICSQGMTEEDCRKCLAFKSHSSK